MGRKRRHNAMLPSGVHRCTKPSGRVLYYWRPHRGTEKAGPSIRLPDDPSSAEFWIALDGLRKPVERAAGGLGKMIAAYQASPHYHQLRPATVREYGRYMAECAEHLGRFEPDALGPAEIAAIRDRFGKTPAKANAIVKAIAALYAWGRERGFARHNPAEGIRKLKMGEHQPWPAWAWEIAQGHFRPELRIACSLALYTGQRLGDVLRMKLGDIREGLITVRQSKTGKTLQIPLHRELLPLVEECRDRGAIYLVSKTTGEPLSTDLFHAMWTREMRRDPHGKVRKDGFVFHGLRKSATVKLAEAGCSEKQIAAVTGMSLTMVEHYSKGADQLRLAREAIRKVENG